jgi:hypothetical protein
LRRTRARDVVAALRKVGERRAAQVGREMQHVVMKERQQSIGACNARKDAGARYCAGAAALRLLKYPHPRQQRFSPPQFDKRASGMSF